MDQVNTGRSTELKGKAMAKRKGGGIELIASMPWPIGLVSGIVAYIAIRYGIGWYLSVTSSPISQNLGRLASTGIYAPFAWLVLAICWAGAIFSFLGSQRRKRLLETQTGLDSLRAISWREFEMLVGEAFRRQGYTVSETGLGGADGGIDLILRKDGKVTLVQCKQWKTHRVDVKVVREMMGLLDHHHAASVKIVAIGDFTADARRFVEDKPIELISGEALLAMVREAQMPAAQKEKVTVAPNMNSATPQAMPQACPKCGADMIKRLNRRTKNAFWGCKNYPACNGTSAK
jgi:restriction system protein